MKCKISLLVRNKPGALSRIVCLFGSTACNIDKMSAEEEKDKMFSHIELIVSLGHNKSLSHITKRLSKNIDVVEVLESKELERI